MSLTSGIGQLFLSVKCNHVGFHGCSWEKQLRKPVSDPRKDLEYEHQRTEPDLYATRWCGTGRWCSLKSQANCKFTFSLPPQREIINDWFCVCMWSVVIIKPALNLCLRVTFLCFTCSTLKWQSCHQFPRENYVTVPIM